MDTFLDILKYILPSLCVLIACLVLVKWFLNAEVKRQKQDFLIMRNKDLFPIKMAAYERATLFLERISAESLVMREQPKAQTCKAFQSHLLNVIRTEYEHNIAIQVHITPETWHLVKNAKEEMLRLVNICAEKEKPEQLSIAMAKSLIEQYTYTTRVHFNVALDALKADVQTFYN